MWDDWDYKVKEFNLACFIWEQFFTKGVYKPYGFLLAADLLRVVQQKIHLAQLCEDANVVESINVLEDYGVVRCFSKEIARKNILS